MGFEIGVIILGRFYVQHQGRAKLHRQGSFLNAVRERESIIDLLLLLRFGSGDNDEASFRLRRACDTSCVTILFSCSGIDGLFSGLDRARVHGVTATRCTVYIAAADCLRRNRPLARPFCFALATIRLCQGGQRGCVEMGRSLVELLLEYICLRYQGLYILCPTLDRESVYTNQESKSRVEDAVNSTSTLATPSSASPF